MTITKEGALASFYTTNKAPIKHLRVYFSPKQAGEGDPSPENVREIEGWNNLEVNITGANLTTFTTDITNYYGWEIQSNLANVELKYIMYIDNTNGDSEACIRMVFRDKNNNNIQRRARVSGVPVGEKRYDTMTLDNIPANAKMIYFGTSGGNNVIRTQPMLMVLKNSLNDISSYEPYKGHTYNLDWSDTFGTIYGGYVDLITGEIVVEQIKNDFESLSWSTRHTGDTNIALSASLTDMYDAFTDISPCICEKYQVIDFVNGAGALSSPDNCDIGVYWYRNSGYTTVKTIYIVIDKNSSPSGNIVYKLKTPITHQLSPTQLSTLLGKNNIWSNADRVEVEYDLAESNDELYRRRNILLKSAPHIVTPTVANLYSFNTDMVAPLKECKVHFEPVQEGEGDPSPDNVRPISGWNELKLWASGKNILPDWKSIYVNRRENGATFNGLTYSFTENGFQLTGTATASGRANLGGSGKTSYFIANNSPILKGGHTYIISYNKTGSLLNNGSGQVSDRSGWIQPNTAFQLVNDGYAWLYHALTTEEGLTYNEKIENVQLELGSVATDYEPYKGIMIPIDWSSELGEISGGYVDIVTGEVWATHWIDDLNQCNAEALNPQYNTDQTTFFRCSHTYRHARGGISNVADLRCDILKPIGINWGDGDAQDAKVNTITERYASYNAVCMRMYNSVFGITAEDSTAVRKQKINAWLAENPIRISYKLETPLLVGLITPAELKTLRGLNNIWSSANGPIELSYWTH